ncbi:MAG: hypothetical protein ACE37K_24075 [Planctomycetota bacterium]
MLAALPALAACTVLFAPQQAPGQESPQQSAQKPLAAALAVAVDAATPAERRAKVDDLLTISSDVDAWLEACRTFGSFAQLEAGPHQHVVELSVLQEVEKTELHVYVPRRYDPSKPAPLLIWLHGSGGSGAGQHGHWQQVSEQLGMLVLAPTEPIETVYAKTPRERASVLAALRWLRRRANVDENGIFVGGWSRGGHLAWDLALRFPDRFAGLAPCVGGPRIELGPGNNIRYLENVRHLPIRDLQGSRDDERLLMNLRLAFKQLEKWRSKDAELIEFPELGHSAELGAVDWATFFQKRREPWPKRVVRLVAEPSEARSAWLELTGLRRKVQVEAQPQVAAARWQRMDEMQKRAFLVKALGSYTARVQIEDKGKGRFVADGSGVTRFALLLQKDQLGKGGKVEVRLKRSKPIRKVGTPSARVLLQDFVERFDRARLPVVRIDVP